MGAIIVSLGLGAIVIAVVTVVSAVVVGSIERVIGKRII